MRYTENFPHKTHVIEHCFITMADGTRLAAKIWLPENASDAPVPAIFEYIPYRKRDFTATRDEIMHHYFAAHGYACIRVDLRGSGDSEGVLTDEYLPQELEDGEAVIAWLTAQSWCSGQVGMIGKSWGGFNGLQIAARQPEPLKAVISVCSTDDRYADDVHYMGGCMLGDNLSWASTMFAFNSSPPDPKLVGDNWRDMWMERIEGSGLWLDTWLQHQWRDSYWQHGSVCEDFSKMTCPVMAVSGWADGYSNAVFRMMESLPGARLGLVGPWSHKYPHEGVPGPEIGFLQEALRWWDYWLKGHETGIVQEPRLRVWMQDSMPPHTSYVTRPGRWVAEDSWPSPNVQPSGYRFGMKVLIPDTEDMPASCTLEDKLYLQSPLSVGLYAGKWCSYSATPDLPHDQREEDGGALTFDSTPLQSDIDILGSVEVEVTFSCDKPVAMLCARLSDIAPDNQSTRVTYGLLNLTHRDGHAQPKPLEPGKKYTVKIPLNVIGQHIPEGHWLRVSLSSSYWPLAWPSPESARLTIYPHECSVQLPLRQQNRERDEAITFDEAEGAAPLATEMKAPPYGNWCVIRDLGADTAMLEVIKDDGVTYLPHADLTVGSKAQEWYRYARDEYHSLEAETLWERSFRRDGWDVSTRTRTVLTSTASHFVLHAELDAYEGNTRVRSLNWSREIARALV